MGVPVKINSAHNRGLAGKKAADRLVSWENTALVILLALGLALRMINLFDPPLDFHPTRQLRSAIIARGMYYQAAQGVDPQLRATAIGIMETMERYEPPILERVVALTYQMIGSEQVWVARVYSSLFWLVGGIALYALVRRMLSPAAALSALAFFLILPWGVTASRVFQPDPWMVMWVLLAAYALFRWSESGPASWKWALLSGLFCGLAVLIKAYAFYPAAAMSIAVVLGWIIESGKVVKGIAAVLRKPQVWVFGALAAVIPAVYYLGLGERSAEFASFWIFSFSDLLLERKFYLQWLGLIRGLMDVMVFFAAWVGVFFLPARGRAQMAGLWAGYFLIGLTFPFQIYTHDYYSLLLVPLAAIGLSGYFHWAFQQMRDQPRFWQIACALVVLVIGGYYTWVARSRVAVTAKYRAEPIPWQIMGRELPQNGAIIGLIHDYGNRLKYYGWRSIQRVWPSQGDFDLSAAAGQTKFDDFETYFHDQTSGMDYFLVTLFADFEAQPQLKQYLSGHYPVVQQGDGYILFDLRIPQP